MGRFFLSLKKNPTFSNIIPCAKYILNTFKLRTLYACLYLFIVYILFAPVILTSIHPCVNNPHIKVLMKVIETKTSNIDFNITINSPIWIILFFCFLHIHIYIKQSLNIHRHTHTHIHRHTHTHIYVYKLVTIVEDDLKAAFSIATTPRCRGGRNSFP